MNKVDTVTFNNKKALLIWKNKEINESNLKNITYKEYKSPLGFISFVTMSILYKNRNLEKYRTQYVKKTGKCWEDATIQDIYNAELVWGF